MLRLPIVKEKVVIPPVREGVTEASGEGKGWLGASLVYTSCFRCILSPSVLPRFARVVRVVQREERVFRTKYCYQDISGEGRGKKQATAVRLTCGCFPSFFCNVCLCRRGLE